MSDKDPIDDLLGELKPVEPPIDARPLAERTFLNHAQQSKQSTAPAWRVWSRWLEPVGAGLFVLIFVIWAIRVVFGG